MKKLDTKTIVGMGLLTAIVVVLQALAVGIRFGMFNITLVLVPIIVGAAVYGGLAGCWLGLVFSIVVLFTDAGAFLAISVPGTVITVVAKGALAGLCAGLVYRALSKKNKLFAVTVAGITAPVVNTGLFLVGCRLFFYDTIKAWGEAAGFTSAFKFMIFGLVGVNFVIELVINLVLAAAIVRIIQVATKTAN